MDWRDPDCRTERNADYVKRMQGQVGERPARTLCQEAAHEK
jgi:hypothetical protein